MIENFLEFMHIHVFKSTKNILVFFLITGRVSIKKPGLNTEAKLGYPLPLDKEI